METLMKYLKYITGINNFSTNEILKTNKDNLKDNKTWKVIDYEGFCAIGINNGEIKKIPLDTIGRILAIDKRI